TLSRAEPPHEVEAPFWKRVKTACGLLVAKGYGRYAGERILDRTHALHVLDQCLNPFSGRGRINLDAIPNFLESGTNIRIFFHKTVRIQIALHMNLHTLQLHFVPIGKHGDQDADAAAEGSEEVFHRIGSLIRSSEGLRFIDDHLPVSDLCNGTNPFSRPAHIRLKRQLRHGTDLPVLKSPSV